MNLKLSMTVVAIAASFVAMPAALAKTFKWSSASDIGLV